MGGGWPLQPNNEAWVENEWWDFCSGIENTYQIIHNSFVSIAEDGDLNQQFQEIFYNG